MEKQKDNPENEQNNKNYLYSSKLNQINPEILSSSHYKNSIQSIKTITGTITAEYINDYIFTREFYKYNNNLNNSENSENYASKKEKEKKFREKLKKSRDLHNDPKSSDFAGPWAKYKDEINFEEEKEQNKININKEGNDEEDILDIIKNSEINEDNKDKKNKKEDNNYDENPDFINPDEDSEKIKPKIIVEYDQGLDYLGRSFISPPSDLKNNEHNCYIPKKLKYTFNGHNKLVQRIQFFPKYGHLLLSCSQDRKIKIWDVFNHKKCI
jgi:pre-mRNA-processing factor 17